jgi:hypothetical protein
VVEPQLLSSNELLFGHVELHDDGTNRRRDYDLIGLIATWNIVQSLEGTRVVVSRFAPPATYNWTVAPGEEPIAFAERRHGECSVRPKLRRSWAPRQSLLHGYWREHDRSVCRTGASIECNMPRYWNCNRSIAATTTAEKHYEQHDTGRCLGHDFLGFALRAICVSTRSKHVVGNVINCFVEEPRAAVSHDKIDAARMGTFES